MQWVPTLRDGGSSKIIYDQSMVHIIVHNFKLFKMGRRSIYVRII